MKVSERVIMFARAKARVKKLETIIGKMVIDAPLGPDIEMLSDEELELVGEIADKYFAESNSNYNSTVMKEGQLYHLNPGPVEQVGQDEIALKEKIREKLEVDKECANDASSTTTKK